MKILLGIISLIICTGFGYFCSRKYTVKRQFYDDFCEFNKNLKTEISFMQNSLLSFVKKFSERKTLFYKNLIENLINKNSINFDKNIFNDDEINFYKNYIENLGGTDKKTQIAFLDASQAHLDLSLNKTKEEEGKYKSLCIKMGFLIGLVAMIILL